MARFGGFPAFLGLAMLQSGGHIGSSLHQAVRTYGEGSPCCQNPAWAWCVTARLQLGPRATTVQAQHRSNSGKFEPAAQWHYHRRPRRRYQERRHPRSTHPEPMLANSHGQHRHSQRRHSLPASPAREPTGSHTNWNDQRCGPDRRGKFDRRRALRYRPEGVRVGQTPGTGDCSCSGLAYWSI